MALLNAEYRVNSFEARAAIATARTSSGSTTRDASPVRSTASSTDWLRGVGVGVGGGGVRVEFGFRANDIPHSRQILVRFSPTF